MLRGGAANLRSEMTDIPQDRILATLPTDPKVRLRLAIKSQINIIGALVLHDMKSRFFGNGWGYVVTILWPAAHFAAISVGYVISGRAVPYGSSMLLFISTGVLPYIVWNYISRFCILGVVQNKSYLSYPIVKPMDLMISRLLLEIMTSSIITLLIVIVIELSGVSAMPRDLVSAVFGLLSAVLLGIGFGVLNSVITLILPIWNIIYVLFLILFWLTSGVALNPEAMPVEIGNIFAWNPLLHCIEWVRAAYYEDIPTRLLDKSYVLTVGATSLALGLILERVLRQWTTRTG